MTTDESGRSETATNHPASEAIHLVDTDLTGSTLERVVMNGSRFRRVRLASSELRSIDLSNTVIRSSALVNTRMIGVEMNGVEITGEIVDVTVNGVEIAPLIDAELDRRDPDRAKMRATDPDGMREAWAILLRRWDATVERARALPPELLHERVEGEWSFIDTLRHLNFASAAWIERMVLGDPAPWHPLDLPWEDAPVWDDIPVDRDARPALDEVLAVRDDRRAKVAQLLDSLDTEALEQTVSRTEPGWPQFSDVPVRDCVAVVLIEEWEHRNYAERDLDQLTGTSSSGP